MRQSKLFTKTLKSLPKDESSYNAQTLIRAGFVDKMAAGIYSFLPLGHRVHEKIKNLIREEMDKIGGQEIFMPALTIKENWTKTGRWDTLDVLFRLAGKDEKEYALGATHEEIISPLAKKFINSYKDLPFSAYQIQTKFRNELRAKSGILRGREFSMKDLYSFHVSQEDLDQYYDKVALAYEEVYRRCGLGDVTYFTYAAGGSFSKYSHEFQTICEAGEDIIYICDQCHVAVNDEIIEDLSGCCPKCGNSELRKEKAVEVGNIFKLGTKFTKPFEVTYTDEKGESNDVIMGCYGIGPSRVMGTIVESNHDDKGIIWPEEVAPFKVHLLSLNKNAEAEDIYDKLVAKGVEVLFDDRELGAGAKFADADLIGIPYRVVISEKSLAAGGVEVKRRSDGESSVMGIREFISEM